MTVWPALWYAAVPGAFWARATLGSQWAGWIRAGPLDGDSVGGMAQVTLPHLPLPDSQGIILHNAAVLDRDFTALGTVGTSSGLESC